MKVVDEATLTVISPSAELAPTIGLIDTPLAFVVFQESNADPPPIGKEAGVAVNETHCGQW